MARRTNDDQLATKDYDKAHYIQIGAFTVRENAYRLQDRLSRRYQNISVSTIDKDGTLFYMVRIGGIKSRSKADNMEERIRKEALEYSFVVDD